MTIILTFDVEIPRARVLAWLDRALRLCPFIEPEISVSVPTPEEMIELH